METTLETQEKQPIRNSNPSDWTRKTKLVREDAGGKSQTIPDLTLNLQNMQRRLAAGLPVTTTSRVIESYYKNLDLTDVQNMQNQLKTKLEKINQAKQDYITKLQEKNANRNTTTTTGNTEETN